MGSKQLLETVRDDSDHYLPEVLDALWAPEHFRTVELISADLSGEDMAVFSLNTNGRGFRLRFGVLPEPMDLELACAAGGSSSWEAGSRWRRCSR